MSSAYPMTTTVYMRVDLETPRKSCHGFNRRCNRLKNEALQLRLQVTKEAKSRYLD